MRVYKEDIRVCGCVWMCAARFDEESTRLTHTLAAADYACKATV